MARRPLKPRKQRKDPNDDPFFIHPDDVPKGKAYQWVATHVLGEPMPRFEEQAKASGWKRVAGYRARAGREGQVLMWAPRKIADAQKQSRIDAAKKQLGEIKELFGILDDQLPYGEGARFRLASDDFMVSSDYPRTPKDAPSVDVDVNVKFRLSRHLQDAASALNLTAEEYAQRRMTLFALGQLTGILFPVGNGALELIENAPFNLTGRF
jgi:hypothetical protein